MELEVFLNVIPAIISRLYMSVVPFYISSIHEEIQKLENILTNLDFNLLYSVFYLSGFSSLLPQLDFTQTASDCFDNSY